MWAGWRSAKGRRRTSETRWPIVRKALPIVGPACASVSPGSWRATRCHKRAFDRGDLARGEPAAERLEDRRLQHARRMSARGRLCTDAMRACEGMPRGENPYDFAGPPPPLRLSHARLASATSSRGSSIEAAACRGPHLRRGDPDPVNRRCDQAQPREFGRAVRIDRRTRSEVQPRVVLRMMDRAQPLGSGRNPRATARAERSGGRHTAGSRVLNISFITRSPGGGQSRCRALVAFGEGATGRQGPGAASTRAAGWFAARRLAIVSSGRASRDRGGAAVIEKREAGARSDASVLVIDTSRLLGENLPPLASPDDTRLTVRAARPVRDGLAGSRSGSPRSPTAATLIFRPEPRTFVSTLRLPGATDRLVGGRGRASDQVQRSGGSG